jgi:hypothetical protein
VGTGGWSPITPPGSDPDSGVQIQAIGGTGKNDLYFSISGPSAVSGVLHSTNSGGSFNLQGFGQQAVPISLFAAATDDIYGVRGVSDVLHSTGNGLWPKQSDLNELADAVFGLSPTSIYVGASHFDTAAAVVYHSTGNGIWTPQPTGVNASYARSITAANANDLYAAFNCGLFHSTGNGTWTEVTLPTGTSCVINAAWAAPDGQLFLVGEKGLILHKR